MSPRPSACKAGGAIKALKINTRRTAFFIVSPEQRKSMRNRLGPPPVRNDACLAN
jgi:hypothetical protein